MKVDGTWRYLYRALDQAGQVIDVYVSRRRDRESPRRFFQRALAVAAEPVEVTTDRAGVYPRLLDELVPAACHVTDRYANNRLEADHGRPKARLRPRRGLKRDRSLRNVTAGHASFRTCGAVTTSSPSTCRCGTVWPSRWAELAAAI